MRIEQRNIYIAEDGTEFASEEACKHHERKEMLSKYIADLIYEETSLSWNKTEEAASVVANNIIRILAAYNDL